MLILTPSAAVTLAGRQVEIAATLRALLTFEELLGFALHATMGRNPTKVARALLWAMAGAAAPSLRDIGRMGPAEMDQALAVAVGLLQAGAPVLEAHDIEAAASAGAADKRSQTDWLELWATGRRDLGLSEVELWECSPAMYWALLKRHEAGQEHAELCAGITAAATQECYRDPEKATEPLDPWLYVLRGKRAAAARKEAERKLLAPNPDLKNKIKSFFRLPQELQAKQAKHGKANSKRGIRIKALTP